MIFFRRPLDRTGGHAYYLWKCGEQYGQRWLALVNWARREKVPPSRCDLSFTEYVARYIITVAAAA
jgi:hypothetical protein